MKSPLTSAIHAEYESLIHGAGIVDVSDRTQVELTGRDRASFLNNFCTNDIKRLAPHEGCEAFVTNVKGKTVGYVHVFVSPESVIIESAPGQADHLIAHLDRYLIREDVEFHDRSGQWHEFMLAGAKASEQLQALTGELPQKRLSHCSAVLADANIWLRNVNWLHAPCYLVVCDADRAGDVWKLLLERGAVACSRDTLEIARVEAATPEFGRDITEENLPQEIDRNDTAINFTKGCYLGQETVARLDALGHVNRKLVSVRFENAGVPAADTKLSASEDLHPSVGAVTSAVWSIRDDRPLALAMVRAASTAPKTRLFSEFGPVEVV